MRREEKNNSCKNSLSVTRKESKKKAYTMEETGGLMGNNGR